MENRKLFGVILRLGMLWLQILELACGHREPQMDQGGYDALAELHDVTSEDIKSVYYFNGGWYGPYPNWKNKFLFEFRESRLTAESPDQTVTQTLTSSNLDELVNLLRNARRILPSPYETMSCQVDFIDGGQQYAVVETWAGKKFELHLGGGCINARIDNPLELLNHFVFWENKLCPDPQTSFRDCCRVLD